MVIVLGQRETTALLAFGYTSRRARKVLSSVLPYHTPDQQTSALLDVIALRHIRAAEQSKTADEIASKPDHESGAARLGPYFSTIRIVLLTSILILAYPSQPRRTSSIVGAKDKGSKVQPCLVSAYISYSPPGAQISENKGGMKRCSLRSMVDERITEGCFKDPSPGAPGLAEGRWPLVAPGAWIIRHATM